MYSDFIFYLSKYIDKEEFTIVSILALSVLLAFILYYFILYSVSRYKETLDQAIDKWYKGQQLTKREERIFYEYQEFKESKQNKKPSE